jgi:dienelactone hydrolase
MTLKHFLIFACALFGTRAMAQFDVTRLPVVYQLPGMDKVIAKKGIVFKTVNDTTLNFDIYYPPDFKRNSDLPVVVFHNGVGINELPGWRAYTDWAKLVAVNGMIAVNHQSRPGKTLNDGGDLITYLEQHAPELKIDKNRIGVWACSANVTTGLPLAMQPERKNIRALVVYYGAGQRQDPDVVQRQELDVLVVRAGLDFYNLNTAIERLVQSALLKDAHFQLINYPEGQHAFDVLDDTPQSKDIVRQTLDFLKTKLSKDYPAHDNFVLTNRVLWKMIVDDKKTDEALAEFKKAIAKYSTMKNHTPFFNHVYDERNLNQMGYQLLEADRTAEAIKVFLANQQAFPESPNVYDGLADGYEKAGDKIKAVTNSKIALEKLENANLPPQAKQAIRESAEAKIKRLQ